MIQLTAEMSPQQAAELIIREDLNALTHPTCEISQVRRCWTKQPNERWLNLSIIHREQPLPPMRCRIRITDTLIHLSEINLCRLDYTAVHLADPSCFRSLTHGIISLLERGEPIRFCREAIERRLGEASLAEFCWVSPPRWATDTAFICRFKRWTRNVFDIDQIEVAFDEDHASAWHYRTRRNVQPEQYTSGGVDKILEEVWQWILDDIRVNRT